MVSAPKILVLNNQTASLQVGDQVPVQTGSTSSLDSDTDRAFTTVEYRDTGVILKVTPRVNASGLVLLDIAQEVSDVGETDSSNINSPSFSTRKIASTIAIQDGQTIALGGLIRDTQTRGRRGLPILSRIPVLGALFGTKTRDGRRTELLILLQPRVIRSVDEGRAATDELIAKIRSVRPILEREGLPTGPPPPPAPARRRR